jgi:hypothetical protein
MNKIYLFFLLTFTSYTFSQEYTAEQRANFAKMIFNVSGIVTVPHWVYKNHALVIKLIKLRDTFLAKFFVVAAKLFNDCGHNIGAQWLSY